MKIISDSHAFIVGEPGAQRNVPPGEPFDEPSESARVLIAAGVARAAALPEIPEGEVVPDPQQAEGSGENMEVVDQPDSPVLSILNHASADKLRTIKGVGRKTAADIIAARKSNGTFESLEDAAERVGGLSVDILEAAAAVV